MTRSRLTVLAIAVIGACVTAPILTGCTPKSEKVAELDAFAAKVAELAFVREATVSANEPLPFSVTAEMTVVLEPETDRDAITELRELTCSVDTMVSPAITLVYTFASGATLVEDRIGQCWTQPVEFVEVLPALTLHETELSVVEWVERDDEDDGKSLNIEVALADDGTVSEVAPSAVIATDMLAALDDEADRSVGLSMRGMIIPAGPLAETRSMVALITDLESKYPLNKVTVDDGLFVELATDAPGVVDEARAYLESTYPDETITAVVDATAEVGGSAPDQELLDAGAVIRDSGLATSVQTDSLGISVETPTLAANVRIGELLESQDMDVRVSYFTHFDGGERVTAGPSGVNNLTAARLADLEAIADALLPSGKVDSISYTPESLKVYLTEQFYEDSASIAQITKAMHKVLDSGDVTGTNRYVELNNKELR